MDVPGELPVSRWMRQRAAPVDAGWARRISHGPRTVAEVLADASRMMDAEDAELERMRDPVAWLRAQRPRSNLLGRLLHGRR